MLFDYLLDYPIYQTTCDRIITILFSVVDNANIAFKYALMIKLNKLQRDVDGWDSKLSVAWEQSSMKTDMCYHAKDVKDDFPFDNLIA